MRRSLNSIRKSKKGDLSLSINAVVILILALAVLGVGIGFINGVFGGLIKKASSFADKVEAQQLGELEKSKEKIDFLGGTLNLKMDTTRVRDVYFSMHNNKNELAEFELGFGCDDYIVGLGAQPNYAKFDFDPKETLEGGQTKILTFNVDLPSGAPSGITLDCEISVKTGGELYAKKGFNVGYEKG